MRFEVLGKNASANLMRLKGMPGFYLAGGTALALQIGHRKSIDLDFFSSKKIPRSLLAKIKKIMRFESIRAIVNNADQLTVFIDAVKASFIHYPFPVLLPFRNYRGIKLLSIKEIAVSKAYTIGRRGFYKDYVDLYFILSRGYTTLGEIITLAEKKYKDAFHARLFLEQLVYLKDAEDYSIHFLKKQVSKSKVQKFFESEIKKMKL